ncbi:LuxR C-terminal-related transcriptional regulator [Pseudomonas multiresinivorans]|uniref:ATP-dependent transcriptional regulator n=1 Tax=Pseudomonas multiresinivorans TaxID=95301 RepID=A0A7Z3BNA7_9PSED|nr:LuxR C-terminal-related transcriptional regulator [Pseudomonas multiresinivorans]QJP09517.1 ATP-dependent transcriptional regulator [Pseudomonas multiresinivorans]
MQGLGVSSSSAQAPLASAPRLPEHHVPRPRLAAAVRGSRQRLTLLCAPAGYGKSTLLAESLADAPSGNELFWLACRGESLSLTQLCAQVASGLGLPSLLAPQALLRQLGRGGHTLHLVLDDLPANLPIEVNTWFEQLLNLPESRVRLIVSCRQRPAWDLPSLLLKGELFELGTDSLGMTRGEYAAISARIAGDTVDARREEIGMQCGDWWSGARLLLAGQQQGRALLRDYLERELVGRMSDEERRLFYGLCNLPRFSVDLCAQLWEGNSGDQVLHRLLRQQVFIQPVEQDGGWYRVHPLVAATLQDGIAAPELTRLRLHACRLLSLAGHLHDAIDQALHVHQPEVAASYIERLKPSWQLADLHLRRVLDWHRQLPSYLMEGTPRLIYLSTLALLLSGRVSEAERGLHGLSRFLPAANAADNQLLLAHWQALKGSALAFRGELLEAEQHCREALGHLGSAPRECLSQLLCQFTLGRIMLASERGDEAQLLWRAALEQARRQGCQDSEALFQGERLRALMLADEAALADLLLQDCLVSRAATGLERDPVRGRLMIARADLLLQQGRLHESEAVLLAAQPYLRDCSAPFVLYGYLGLAEVAGRHADLALAQAQIQRGERAMHCGRIDEGLYQAALALQQLKLLVHAQDWRAALEASRRLALEYPVGSVFSIVLPPTVPHHVQWFAAMAEHNLGLREQSRARLQVLAEHCRVAGFRQLQAEVLAFLRQCGGADEDEGADACGYQEELTVREVAVLELLAEGLSNQEIADALFLSVNTVKYHAKNINAKLGATRRTQAIACAKARGLLA